MSRSHGVRVVQTTVGDGQRHVAAEIMKVIAA